MKKITNFNFKSPRTQSSNLHGTVYGFIDDEYVYVDVPGARNKQLVVHRVNDIFEFDYLKERRYFKTHEDLTRYMNQLVREASIKVS